VDTVAEGRPYTHLKYLSRAALRRAHFLHDYLGINLSVVQAQILKEPSGVAVCRGTAWNAAGDWDQASLSSVIAPIVSNETAHRREKNIR
jgi:hypothetical protein